MKQLINEHNFTEYFVADLLNEKTQIIFVLESPHTQEVKNHYPVAGKSGKDMSKVLLEDEQLQKLPFGQLIYEEKIPNFGILNVSNIPLQKSAYKMQKDEIFRDFELIRQNPSLRKKACALNNTIETLQADFKSRLELHKDKKVVLCGGFVQKIFNDLFPHAEFKNIIEVPHPSFNNWSKQKYAPKIQELLEFIQ